MPGLPALRRPRGGGPRAEARAVRAAPPTANGSHTTTGTGQPAGSPTVDGAVDQGAGDRLGTAGDRTADRTADRRQVLDGETGRVISAFQMRYRPARFDGVPDAETAAMLDVLTSK